MSEMRDIISKARKRQQEHERRIPVQLQIEAPPLWATEDEVREEFHRLTPEPLLTEMWPGWKVDRDGRFWYSSKWLDS